MIDTPALSFIVPVFNVKPYLAKCLDSLLGQTFSDIEIVCVDDCSTDGSYEMLCRYAELDFRVRVFRHEENLRREQRVTLPLSMQMADIYHLLIVMIG